MPANDPPPPTSSACPFCTPDPARVFLERELVLGLWDAFPVSPGHALLVPRRHVADWFEATTEERRALEEAIPLARDAILARHRPDGFNIGINIGEAAGQTIFHLHAHLIPRYRDDVPDPRGGVRHVIPSKADYLAGTDSGVESEGGDRDDKSPPGPLVAGGDEPLLPRLLADLDGASRLDLAVAFTLESGVRRIEEHLRDLLRRGGHVRLVTGDYLDFTDPDALLRLLDLADAGRGQLEVFVFETRDASYHPKAYVIHDAHGHGRAYVGSSNLSRTALEEGGIEWNYRVVSPDGFRAVTTAFRKLLEQPEVRPVDVDWIDAYRRRRRPPSSEPIDVPAEPGTLPPEPHSIQKEALEALDRTRSEGNSAGLVVLATGLGKTWLSAFDIDSNQSEYRRVLFVAHREEILEQARKTFRIIRPSARLGLFTGKEKVPDADVLFASIQTMSRKAHLQRFDRQHFDYIVIDEFHHAAARTYRRLIDHFEPGFLLGLTATPERTDGGDLLALCGENLVYRCGLPEGIGRELLSPFHYFGVPDEVDYENIPWRSSRFDEEALTQAVATEKRAQNAFEHYETHGGRRVLAFCCSQRHADFMAGYFEEKGASAVAVHSGERSAPRAASLERLNGGELDVVFAVDMFNEGVDLPDIDTVMMLRPTESRILWLQQLGRGLRRSEGKTHLTVIDYIGNHRQFLLKPQALFDLGAGDHEVARILRELRDGTADLPPGCAVTYDLAVVDILQSLLRPPSKDDALRMHYEDFRERHGRRPLAVEVFHDGYSPASLRPGHGSWPGFVDSMGDLSKREAAGLRAHRGLFEALERTQMTKSYKMLVLLAMLNLDCLPGEIDIDDLAEEFERLAKRSARLREDVGPDLMDPPALERLLERNPIAAWCGGKGTGGTTFFAYRDRTFRTTFDVPIADRRDLQELVRELADWRLAQYLSRRPTRDGFECKVSQTNGRPILFLPDRKTRTGIPIDWTPVLVDGRPHEANFVKIAVNVVRESDSTKNQLPTILRQWFGPDAGRPGTRHQVVFRREDDAWVLEPLGGNEGSSGAERWASYAREQIPGLFGIELQGNIWRQGFILKPEHIFLLVTLDKGSMPQEHRYEDRFLSANTFEWQSQNRTTQKGKHGRSIRDHGKLGLTVHLFVRQQKKSSGRTMPFTYCGPVDFVDWEGEKPITVRWKLRDSLPERLRKRFCEDN